MIFAYNMMCAIVVIVILKCLKDGCRIVSYLSYQNEVCCGKKLNLVGNIKYCLVFENPH